MIRSYFQNRWQCVVEKGKFSSKERITIGVPQGSILGPLFFLVYINDLPTNVPSKGKILFADDTTLLDAAKTIEDVNHLSENSLKLAANWLTLNELTMNKEKNQNIIFSLATDYTSSDHPNSVTLLGFVLDGTLTWHSYIHHFHCRNILSF